jgi:hypothetical protein
MELSRKLEAVGIQGLFSQAPWEVMTTWLSIANHCLLAGLLGILPGIKPTASHIIDTPGEVPAR